MSDTRQVGFGTASAPASRRNSFVAESLEPSPPSSGRTAAEEQYRYQQDAGLTRTRATAGGVIPSSDDVALYPKTHATDYAQSQFHHTKSAPTSPGLMAGDVPGSLSGAVAGSSGETAVAAYPFIPAVDGNDGAAGVRSTADPGSGSSGGTAYGGGPVSSTLAAGESVVPAASSANVATAKERPSNQRAHSTGRDKLTLRAPGEDGQKQQQHHHRHHGSGRHTPVGGLDPYFLYNYPNTRGFSYDRPANHQTSHHKTPLYSLARPLPTQEQRNAQRAYREDVRARAADPAARQHHHSNRSTPTATRRNTAGETIHIGPGAVHHGGVAAGPFYAPPTHYPHHVRPGTADGGLSAATDKEQLMILLRQLLNEGKGKEDGAEVQSVRSDSDDNAVARKEGYEKADKTARRTAAAERRDSVNSSSSASSSSYDDDEEEFPNPWARVRHTMREVFAEYLGTLILVLFGTGVSLQYFLSTSENVVSSPRGTYLSVSFGWGIGAALGIWVAGGISGGHINPAVTISLAAFRGFPLKKVPGYILAQILGSMTAAGLNYAMYRRAISIFEGAPGLRTISGDTATASLFSTYPLEYMSDANCFFQEFLDSSILMIVVLAISDSNNASPPDGLNPLVIFLLITGIGAALGMQTAYCINPARDLGPRLVTWFAGYGRDVWNFRRQYWLWTPILATILGALFGSLIYDTLIYTGSESPTNMKWQFPWAKKNRAGFGPASKEKMPAGQTEA